MSAHKDDLFDSVIFFEENCQAQGYQDGFEEGKLNGWQEGFEIGFEKGHEFGGEIGFYKGFISTWLVFFESNQQHGYERVKVKLESLWKLLSQDWRSSSEDLTSEFQTVRAKFKQICSMLNISTGYGAAKASEISF